MTPAEKLSKAKPRKREPRNKKPAPFKPDWHCACRELREQLRLGFDEVVKALGMSRTAYWKIEKGGDPMLTTAVKIATFYGRDVSQLWKAL